MRAVAAAIAATATAATRTGIRLLKNRFEVRGGVRGEGEGKGNVHGVILALCQLVVSFFLMKKLLKH